MGYLNQTNDMSTKKPCLAACEDQLNLVTETSSSFPNSQTFHRREEFCLIVHKLVKTCSTVKRAALTDTYPTLCELLSVIPENEKQSYDAICPNGAWNPEVKIRNMHTLLSLNKSHRYLFYVNKNMF